MPKPKNQRKSPKSQKSAGSRTAIAQPKGTGPAPAKKAETSSKQDRLVAMLRSPTGATIAAMMKTTGWQQHSVRGFLAGVVRKRLKLKLVSEPIDGNRVYRIAAASVAAGGAGQPKRRTR
jgi:hypothetical protein